MLKQLRRRLRPASKHPESEQAVFGELARIAKKLIVIEDERSDTWRHFRRRYRPIFEGLGMKQTHEAQPFGLPGSYVARVFTPGYP